METETYKFATGDIAKMFIGWMITANLITILLKLAVRSLFTKLLILRDDALWRWSRRLSIKEI